MPEPMPTFDPKRLADTVPACLRDRPQWVCWQYIERDGKATKCPISPTKGGNASSTDESTWGTFNEAISACCRCSDLCGVGFVFTDGDPFAGIDFDDCIEPDTGNVKPWAQDILRQLDSYSEISPSGTGVKVFLRAAKPGPRCKTGYEDGAVEMYDQGRFFTVTGETLPDTPADVEERSAEFNAVYTRVFGTPEAVNPSVTKASSNGHIGLADDEIVRLACSRKRSGPKFTALWAGRWNDYFNSPSEADSSVVFTLAFYTKDAAQIDRIYRRCRLFREKWDELHGAQTYGEMTIAKALEKVTGQYKSRRKRKKQPSVTLTTPSFPPPTSGRPQIQGNERQLRDVRTDALNALVKVNDPPRLFRRGDGIARIGLVQFGDETTTASIQQLDPNALRGEMTNAADWFTLRHPRQGDVLDPDSPPLSVARDILALPQVDLPPLAGIVTCPAFASDGNLIIEDGYDAGSGLWHHRTVENLPEVPDEPTPEDVAQAKNLLLDMFADFPFTDDAGRANALALVLLPFVRELVRGPTPLHAVDAPTPATGKDLLVKTALLPALGHEVGATTAAKDPDEWRKKITSALVAGSPAILWGNLTHRLDSEHLAAVLTDTAWRDRQLGHTRELALPNRAVWSATGNNLSFSKELARRVVWIRLDARVEQPEQRTGFKYPNLLRHVLEHRGQYVAAALTVVRAWLVAGRPQGTRVMGSFESYAAVMGGILDVAGVEGFLTNAQELRRHTDTETGEWRAFVQAWWERWNDAWVGVSDLASLLWTDDGSRSDLLMGVVTSERERGVATQLGKRLSAKRECVIGGYRIVVNTRPDKSGRLQYRLTPLESPSDRQTSADLQTSKNEVCHEVCQRNCSTGNELEDDGRHGILFSRPPRACVRACAHAPRDEEGEPPRKSAMSAEAAQLVVCKAVSTADLPADIGQTSSPTVKRSADEPPSAVDIPLTPLIAWYRRNGDDVPQAIADLASRREGWTPYAWRERLRQLADRCEHDHPRRAAELREAAALMGPSTEQNHAS